MKGTKSSKFYGLSSIRKRRSFYFLLGFLSCAIFTKLLGLQKKISEVSSEGSEKAQTILRHNIQKNRFEIKKRRGRSRNVIKSLSSDGRDVLSDILQELSMKNGVEVGVLMGNFSKQILSKWEKCEKYVLVDPWLHQENYNAKSNVEQNEQEIVMKTALENIKPWKNIVETCRDFSNICAMNYNNSNFDYVYIDARHDFKGVFEDLKLWYPKVRTGGIISGHDYMDDLDVYSRSKSNWTVQPDGSLDYGRQAVKGAVNLFFAGHEQYVNILNDTSAYRSWVVLKSGGKRKYNTVMHFLDFRCFDPVLCDYTPDEILQNIKQWEIKHPDFISILWTFSAVEQIFPDEISIFRNEYKGNTRLFSDYMKFKILHKYGGFVVNNSLWPHKRVDRIVGSGIRTKKPFIVCNSQGYGKFLVKIRKICPHLFSPFLFGSPKNHKELSNMASMHINISRNGNFSDETIVDTIFLQVWKHYETMGLEIGAPFPCLQGIPSERCVASIRGTIE